MHLLQESHEFDLVRMQSKIVLKCQKFFNDSRRY